MKVLLCILPSLLTCGIAWSLPPEGLESFALIGSGQSTSITTHLGYVSPKWTSNYQTLNAYFGRPTFSKGFLTYGASVTVGENFGARDAYFVRHDFQLISTNSISIKLLHEDYKYIPSGHDSVAIEFNNYIAWTEGSGTYLSVGIFNKWNKYMWNGPWWIPMYLNTNDSYAFFTATLGFKKLIGERSFFTLDANTRDPFSYYSLDHVGFDWNLNLAVGESSFVRILLGLRTTAFWMGTMTPSSYQAMIGLYSQ